MSFSCGPAAAMISGPTRSVTVGTSTSASAIAAFSRAASIGISSALRLASKDSRISRSIPSGSLRVTMTSGFFSAMCVRFDVMLAFFFLPERLRAGKDRRSNHSSRILVRTTMMRYPLALVFLLIVLLGRSAEAADTQPYFLSIKNEKTFMREGPGENHRIKWIYHRKGLPVEVIASFEVWRRVRDAAGET